VLPVVVPAMPWSPTAHTSVGLSALIALKWKNAFTFELPTSGIGTTLQAVPFQCSE
jgi:hypothetical protein